MSKKRPHPGTLIIVGGHEDKEGDRDILTELARRVGKGRLVVTTVASDLPEELWADYGPLFRDLGVKDTVHLDIRSRADATLEANIDLFKGATAVFFTGGDQLRITSQIGDTPIYRCLQDLYERGGTIAGTSAGASVMTETMLVGGISSDSMQVGSTVRGALRMAPGLGLLKNAVVDQHFAERGRIGRLVAVVAQNPRILGIGVDEDTAIVVEGDRTFEVIGSGAVYVVDGSSVTDSNLSEADEEATLSIYDVRLHLLSQGDRFDLVTRRPNGVPGPVAVRVTAAEHQVE